VLIWDPGCRRTLPVELAVLADERVVTGGSDQRVVIWHLGGGSTLVIQLAKSGSR